MTGPAPRRRHAAGRLLHWFRFGRDAARLSDLDDHLLRDIGLTRREAGDLSR